MTILKKVGSLLTMNTKLGGMGMADRLSLTGLGMRVNGKMANSMAKEKSR